ncbi:alpha/beta hydrolase family esterase [Aureibaculum conchae]|uniref:alpha/beta hydrolase family esterase n=1 Tax=Aureibaculum sp. 2308TA14-22 TaxID=3108392 RepID=UPI00339A32BD
MKKYSLILLVLFIAFCSEKALSQTNNENLILNQKIVVDGTKREYHMYMPNKQPNKPLVILLHGNRGSYNQVIGKRRIKSPQKVWLDLAKQHNFIVVVPNGNLGTNNKRGWNDCRNDVEGNPESNDVLFISQLLDKIKTEYNHNEDKVFVAGVSNGGQMAMRLAMEIPEKITAFAAIIASMPENSKCKDSNIPISALFMNGTADPILPYEGGQMASSRGLVKSTEESIAYWVKRNGIFENPIENSMDDIDKKDKSTATKLLYKKGTNNTEVTLCRIINGGHTEPSKKEKYRKFFKSIVGNQNTDIEMAYELWDFFKDKKK